MEFSYFIVSFEYVLSKPRFLFISILFIFFFFFFFFIFMLHIILITKYLSCNVCTGFILPLHVTEIHIVWLAIIERLHVHVRLTYFGGHHFH